MVGRYGGGVWWRGMVDTYGGWVRSVGMVVGMVDGYGR